MNRYTIYCTEEQTKKTFELGAPIDMFTEDFDPRDILPEGCEPVFISKREETTHFQYWLVPPTAEQMVGWLEEQLQTQISISFDKYRQWFFNIGYGNTTLYDTHKEATLAAIDAALDYLADNKL